MNFQQPERTAQGFQDQIDGGGVRPPSLLDTLKPKVVIIRGARAVKFNLDRESSKNVRKEKNRQHRLKYYRKNTDLINQRRRDRWAAMSQKEREEALRAMRQRRSWYKKRKASMFNDRKTVMESTVTLGRQ